MVHIPSEQEFGNYADWNGRQALDRDGGTLGRIEEIFLDTETRQPEWVLVRLDDVEGHRLVPLPHRFDRGHAEPGIAPIARPPLVGVAGPVLRNAADQLPHC